MPAEVGEDRLVHLVAGDAQQDVETTAPARESTAISVVPPPMSTISEPRASVTGMSSRSPPPWARRSGTRARAGALGGVDHRSPFHGVMPTGTAMTTCGFTQCRPSCTLLMK